MPETSLIQNRLYSLKVKALHALEELIDLPTLNSKGKINKDIIGPKMLALRMLMSADLPDTIIDDRPIPILSEIQRQEFVQISNAVNEVLESKQLPFLSTHNQKTLIINKNTNHYDLQAV